jgi:hypothetical protein
MRYYCTLSDKNYLKQGLALIRSLKKVMTSPFTIYYLCLDEETFAALDGQEQVIAIPLPTVEATREELLKYKQRKPYNEYCWALASSFCRYLFEEVHLSDVLYIDSDVYFYSNPQIIYDELGDKSIGIIRHRHNTSSSGDGEFNVGIIYFKNNEDGSGCLRWWNDCIIEESRPELATCGDQKYLEEFQSMYPKSLCILDKTFAHGAPWNFRLYVYDNYPSKGTVIWGDREQPLVFNHFSRFSMGEQGINPTSGQYMDHTLNSQVFSIPVVAHFYLEYAKEILV